MVLQRMKGMSWVDALVFALVAVYFSNLFFFQNYVIPSSSLEKSLLTGDYLFVSKVSHGPRSVLLFAFHLRLSLLVVSVARPSEEDSLQDIASHLL